MNKKIHVNSRSETFSANVTLMPEGYGGWLAMNIGTGNVEVDGFVLEPGQMLDFSHLGSGVVWNSPIPVVCQTGGVVRITRLIYSLK